MDGFYHFWLGDLYSRAGRFADAIGSMQEATTVLAPCDAYYNVRLGVVSLQAGLSPRGGRCFPAGNRVLEPDNASYHCLLGDASARLGFERQALQHYRSAGRLDPYDALMLTGFAR